MKFKEAHLYLDVSPYVAIKMRKSGKIKVVNGEVDLESLEELRKDILERRSIKKPKWIYNGSQDC